MRDMKILCKTSLEGAVVVILELGDRLTKASTPTGLKLVDFHSAARASTYIKGKPKWFSPSMPSKDESVRNSSSPV